LRRTQRRHLLRANGSVHVSLGRFKQANTFRQQTNPSCRLLNEVICFLVVASAHIFHRRSARMEWGYLQ
jgi:hypothetical protein